MLAPQTKAEPDVHDRKDQAGPSSSPNAGPSDVPPPAYTQQHATVVAQAGGEVPPPPNINPTNHISIVKRMGEIKETFVLDPALQLPQYMQSPDAHGANLVLSNGMGDAKARVHVLGTRADGTISQSQAYNGKTRIQMSSTMGTTKLELHAPHHRAPLSLSVRTVMGDAKLILPRSFRGPLNVSVTFGEIKLSKALQAASTKLGNGRLFIGGWTQDEMQLAVWPGDEAEVETKMGDVSVKFDDEGEKKGMLKRMMS